MERVVQEEFPARIEIAMADETKPSVTDTLIKAMEHADEMEHVLILWSDQRDGKNKTGCFDNDLTVSEALFMVTIYQHWLLNHVTHDPNRD